MTGLNRATEPSELQGAASATLSAIMSKRMEAQPKLHLIQQMQVAPVAAQWEAVANRSGELDEEMAEHLASFLNVLACETIDSLKRIENQFISMQECIAFRHILNPRPRLGNPSAGGSLCFMLP